jgi:hypothetical protein
VNSYSVQLIANSVLVRTLKAALVRVAFSPGLPTLKVARNARLTLPAEELIANLLLNLVHALITCPEMGEIPSQ